MPKLDNKTARAVNNAQGSAFVLVDEDRYRLRLTQVSVAPRPDSSGNTYWVWRFEVVSGETSGDKFKGSKLRCNTNFGEDAQWFAKQMFDAFEAKPNVDTDELLGHEIDAIVGQREIQSGARKGQMTNDIQQVMPVAKDGEGDDDWAAEEKTGKDAKDAADSGDDEDDDF